MVQPKKTGPNINPLTGRRVYNRRTVPTNQEDEPNASTSTSTSTSTPTPIEIPIPVAESKSKSPKKQKTKQSENLEEVKIDPKESETPSTPKKKRNYKTKATDEENDNKSTAEPKTNGSKPKKRSPKKSSNSNDMTILKTLLDQPESKEARKSKDKEKEAVEKSPIKPKDSIEQKQKSVVIGTPEKVKEQQIEKDTGKQDPPQLSQPLKIEFGPYDQSFSICEELSFWWTFPPVDFSFESLRPEQSLTESVGLEEHTERVGLDLDNDVETILHNVLNDGVVPSEELIDLYCDFDGILAMLDAITPSDNSESKVETELDENEINEPSEKSELLQKVPDSQDIIIPPKSDNDAFDFFFSIEKTMWVVPHDYMKNMVLITLQFRAQMIDWLIRVHQSQNYVGETLHRAINLVDHYLAADRTVNKRKLLLIALAALLASAKCEENDKVKIADFLNIPGVSVSASEICESELTLLNAVDFRVGQPLIYHFLYRLKEAANGDDRHFMMSKYFLELAMVDKMFSTTEPSRLAAAAIFLAIHLLKGNPNMPSGLKNEYWTDNLTKHSRYEVKDFSSITNHLAYLVYNVQSSPYQTVYKKYSLADYQKTSLRTELYGNLMKSIANTYIPDF